MPDIQALYIYNHTNVSERLDTFLVSCIPDFSRSRIQSLIKNGHVLVNKKTVLKPGSALDSGDHITISIPPNNPSPLLPEAIDLDIIFENDDVLVINKPAGMVVHPSPGHDHGTLVHAVLGHVPKLEGIGGEERPGIVHRLDKDTSGIILVAKNEQSHHWLQEQFRSRKVEKTYLALVDGKPPSSRGRIEAPIGRNTSHRKLMGVVPIEKGREAVSEYHVLQNFPHQTLLEIHPFTGRTHQIRVHLAFIGCPIVGDTVYGKKKPSINITRHFLHASKLKIILQSKEKPMIFEAALPDDLRMVLDSIDKKNEEA
jgi:23S rRNA pseudouridine1911/1915/1917 synthase